MEKMRARHGRGFFASSFALFLLVFLSAACGRKAPPVPPSFEGLKPPTGVVAELQGEDLVVRWNDPIEAEKDQVTGWRIDLASLKDGETLCDGCPVVFETVGTARSFDRRFSVSVSRGSLYKVEIRALSEAGYVSSPSRRAVLDLRVKTP